MVKDNNKYKIKHDYITPEDNLLYKGKERRRNKRRRIFNRTKWYGKVLNIFLYEIKLFNNPTVRALITVIMPMVLILCFMFLVEMYDLNPYH